MTAVSENVDYVSIYFILGETPQGWTRNAIKDPPSGGWSNAFIVRKDGFLPRIFIPYTVQSWSVPVDCYELERTRDPVKPLDTEWMRACIERSYNSRLSSGIPMDTECAATVIEAMGLEVPDLFKSEEAAKAPKEKKVKPKSAIREARTGLISVATIAEELKIVPRVARGYLRAAKIEKPAVGWAGNEAWAESIKKIIQAEMSKESKRVAKIKAVKKPAKPEPKKKPVAKKKAAPKPAKKVPARAPKAKAGKKLPPVILPKKKVAERVMKKAKKRPDPVVLTHGLTLKDLLKSPKKKGKAR